MYTLFHNQMMVQFMLQNKPMKKIPLHMIDMLQFRWFHISKKKEDNTHRNGNFKYEKFK
jgi:hypothetical protein